MHAHIHVEAFRPNPCYGQLMGFPANLDFEWWRWIEDGLLDAITLRTNWFEAMDYRSKSGIRRNLPAELDDPVAREALSLARYHQIPVTLSRYLQWVPSLDDYVSELAMIFHDRRFKGFDLYEQMFLFRPTSDGKRLMPFGVAMEKIRRKTSELGLI